MNNKKKLSNKIYKNFIHQTFTEQLNAKGKFGRKLKRTAAKKKLWEERGSKTPNPHKKKVEA